MYWTTSEAPGPTSRRPHTTPDAGCAMGCGASKTSAHHPTRKEKIQQVEDTYWNDGEEGASCPYPPAKWFFSAGACRVRGRLHVTHCDAITQGGRSMVCTRRRARCCTQPRKSWSTQPKEQQQLRGTRQARRDTQCQRQTKPQNVRSPRCWHTRKRITRCSMRTPPASLTITRSALLPSTRTRPRRVLPPRPERKSTGMRKDQRMSMDAEV